MLDLKIARHPWITSKFMPLTPRQITGQYVGYRFRAVDLSYIDGSSFRGDEFDDGGQSMANEGMIRYMIYAGNDKAYSWPTQDNVIRNFEDPHIEPTWDIIAQSRDDKFAYFKGFEQVTLSDVLEMRRIIAAEKGYEWALT